MKKIVLLSFALHVVLGLALAPWLITRMEFDQQEEEQRTEEVKKRELARQEYEKLKRERQKLDEETARKLRKEAKRKKLEEIKKRTADLRKRRDEILERQKKELAKLQERNREDIIAAEALSFTKLANRISERVDQATENLTRYSLNLGAYQNGHDRGSNGLYDQLTIFPGALEPPFSGIAPLHTFAFDGDTSDGITKKEGTLIHGAKVIDLPDSSGQALKTNGGNARAQFWPMALGDAFTVTFRLNLAPKTDDFEKHSCLIANNHSNSYNKGFRFYLEPTDAEATASTLVLETTGSSSDKGKTKSLPNAFTFHQWHDLALVIHKTEGWAKIYLNGKDITSKAETTVATTFPTPQSTMDGTAKEMAEALAEKINETPPTPESADDLKKDLGALTEKLDQRMSEHPDEHAFRNNLKQADDAAEQLDSALDALTQKTDLAKMNDTSASVADKMSPDANASTPAELYAEAQELEKQIAAAHSDITAAKTAVTENTSYTEARLATSTSTPARPNLESALSENSGEGSTIADLNKYRQSLNQASNVVADMNARAQNMLDGADNRALSNAPTQQGSIFASQAARFAAASNTERYGAVVNMTAFGLGVGDGDSTGLRGDFSGEGAAMAAGKKQQSIRLNEHDIIAKALPGRRFTNESARRGWLYLDTWYVIGPWENDSQVNFEKTHPPEQVIDFDALYYDGKYADQPDHPDHVLKWEFYQSDSVRCQPPRVYGASTYYAYTELWFEQERDMLIAVASDDAASMWLNDQIVWADTGQSSWSLGEGYRRVRFKQGFNTLLVRIENGPIHCVWSVLLCPPEVIEKDF
ncbi:MAG: hypothetical protein ACON4R_08110 [Akkermansiaceae bacterium]